MKSFKLLDLDTQATEVCDILRGRDREEVLSWLGEHGEVAKIHSPYDDELYTFRSPAGIVTGFRLSADSMMSVLSDHTVRQP